MVIREVKPFDDKQWAQLQKEMRDGPTPEQAKKMAEIRGRIKKINRENF